MTSITITDLNNAKLDVDHVAAVATSAALTATDRLGHVKRTLAGMDAAAQDAIDENIALILDAGNVATTQAGIATTQAELATTNGAAQVALATTEKTAAQTAKTAAEAARDAANAVGKVFTSTELGIAGTTSGQSFSVLSVDLLDLIVYTNSAGTAVELFRFRTKALIDTLMDTTYSTRSGYAWAIIGQSNGMAIGVRNDGHVIFGHGGDIATRLDVIENATGAADQASYARSGYVWAVIDQFSDIALGLDNAGNLITKGKNINDILLTGAGYERSGYVWGILDAAGNIALGLDKAGNLISKGQIVLPGLTSAQIAAIAVNSKWITPSGFYWYGDSLSASGVGGWLATSLGKAVTVGAVGGQTSSQIAARFGGQVPLFTVTGNTIPASGGVAVTTRSIDPITSSGGGPITGKLAGIPGTFTSDGSTYWTFTRTTAGAALVIDPATPFLIDFTNDRLFGTVVFWYGRNNVGSGTFNADVRQAIADSIAQLKTADKRFVILSVLNWPGETTGTANYNAVEQLNTDLKTLYPRNYVDVLNLLRRSGDGSANDIADAASGIIPRSLRNSSADGHLNNTTGNPIVATRVFQFLTEKGWLA